MRATRALEFVSLGASVRGSLALERAARAWALVHGRDVRRARRRRAAVLAGRRPPPAARAGVPRRRAISAAEEIARRVWRALPRARAVPRPRLGRRARSGDAARDRVSRPARLPAHPAPAAGRQPVRRRAQRAPRARIGDGGHARLPSGRSHRERSTGRRRRGSRPRAAATSSSCASASPRRRRSSRSCSTDGRRWRIYEPPSPWLDKPAAAAVAVRAIVESADAVRAVVGAVRCHGPRPVAARATEPWPRGDRDARARACTVRRAGRRPRRGRRRLAERRATAAGGQLRVRHLRLPRLVLATASRGRLRSLALRTSCRSSSRTRRGSAASPTCSGVVLPIVDVATGATAAARLTPARGRGAQRRAHEAALRRAAPRASGRPAWIPSRSRMQIRTAMHEAFLGWAAPATAGAAPGCDEGAGSQLLIVLVAVVARPASALAGASPSRPRSRPSRAPRRRGARDAHGSAPAARRTVAERVLAVRGRALDVEPHGEWGRHRRRRGAFDLQCLEAQCAPGPGARDGQRWPRRPCGSAARRPSRTFPRSRSSHG